MNGPMPNMPFDNLYEWEGQEPGPVITPEESKNLEIAISYQSVTETYAWRDMLNMIDASVIDSESDLLMVKAGEPYEKRVETMIVWQQRKLLRRIVEQRAKEMIAYLETAIQEGISSHGDDSNRTRAAAAESYADSFGASRSAVTERSDDSSTDASDSIPD